MNKKLIKEYTKFRENSKFKVKKFVHINEQIWVDDYMLEDEFGKKYAGNENIINISYTFKDSISKSLSNLFKYDFIFRKKM